MMRINTKWWLDYCISAFRTGSTVICDPPIKGTDYDYLLLVDPETVPKLEEALIHDGYKLGGSLSYSRTPKPLEAYPSYDSISHKEGNIFHSWRKDQDNVIITCCEEYFTNFYKATCLAARLNLKEKEDRVALFHSICTDNWPNYSWLWLKRRG